MSASEDKELMFFDRIKHPYLGSALSAAIIHNWKLFIIVTSVTVDMEVRIENVEDYLKHASTWDLFGLPLTMGVVVSIFIPLYSFFFKVMVDWWSAKSNIVKEEIKFYNDQSAFNTMTKSKKIADRCYANLSTLYTKLNAFNSQELPRDYFSIRTEVDQLRVFLSSNLEKLNNVVIYTEALSTYNEVTLDDAYNRCFNKPVRAPSNIYRLFILLRNISWRFFSLFKK